MKKVIITQSNYIPWKAYFDAINMVDEFVVYDDMQFTKRDWRNRNKIKTPQGLKWLTIPVQVKGKYLQKINETLISDPKWGQNHWKTIVLNYKKTPGFSEYAEAFEQLYLRSGPERLSEINLDFIRLINKILGITTPIRMSGEFELTGNNTERLVNICRQTGATDYYTGPRSKNYMDETLFAKAGINVHYFDYSNYPEYPQLYGDFVHEVSIVDLLFHTGTTAKRYMKSF